MIISNCSSSHLHLFYFAHCCLTIAWRHTVLLWPYASHNGLAFGLRTYSLGLGLNGPVLGLKILTLTTSLPPGECNTCTYNLKISVFQWLLSLPLFESVGHFSDLALWYVSTVVCVSNLMVCRHFSIHFHLCDLVRHVLVLHFLSYNFILMMEPTMFHCLPAGSICSYCHMFVFPDYEWNYSAQNKHLWVSKLCWRRGKQDDEEAEGLLTVLNGRVVSQLYFDI